MTARVDRRPNLAMLALISVTACSGGPSSEPPSRIECSTAAVDDRIAILGDSIFQFGRNNCTHVGRYLAELVGGRFPDHSVSGATMRELAMAPFWTIPVQYALGAVADTPMTVVFDGGLNDLYWLCLPADRPSCADAIAGNAQDFGSFVALLRSDGVQNIVYLGPYHISPTGSYGDLAATIDLWSELMAETAAAVGVVYVDPRDAFDAAPGSLAPDGLHPSPTGAAQLAELLHAAMLANGLLP